MDGKILLYQLRQLLEEPSTSSYLDDRTSYDFLYEAACAYAEITKSLTGSQTITTTATTSAYALNNDYMNLYVTNDRNEYVIKYYDGSGYYYIPWRDYGPVFYQNSTTDQSIPNSFSIVDASFESNISSAATSTGTATLGECNLTDTGQTFLTTISPGDPVHNTTDASDGIVLAVTSNTVCVVALFGGTNNYVTSGDSYVIVPQGRKSLLLDPASLTAGHTITIPYVVKPMPVYSYSRRYRFDATVMPAIVKYAAWLYKYRDREANFGDRWYQVWEAAVRRHKGASDKSFNKGRWGVNFQKRTLTDRSYR